VTVIRAALFDFGGVIVGGPFEAFSTYERDHDLPDGFLRRVNATDPDTNAWARLERGEVDIEGFGPLFEAESAALGHPVDGRQVLALLTGAAGPSGLRPAMVDAVRRCGERLATGLLTNNFVTVGGEGMQTSRFAEVLALFDAIIESSQVGVRKPDPRFYELACATLAIDPTEAVFLDDLGINLKPARAMGMTTIKVGDPTVAIAELEQVVGFALA
jgi:putative hydrolase of the HAD superfamily